MVIKGAFPVRWKPQDGKDAYSPYIGSNGNWYFYNDTTQQYEDSGRSATGDDGHSPYIYNGYWYEWNAETQKYENTNIKAKGEDGDSVTVTSSTIKYASSTSGTVRPTSGWQTTIPTVAAGSYLWTWTHIVFSDGSSTDMYSVSMMGKTGAAGASYLPVDNGIYSASSSYSWTNGRRDFVDYEIDGVYYRFGVKTIGQTVPANNPPVSGGNTYWEQVNVINTLITNCLFGTNAIIGGFTATGSTMTSQNGSMTLDGIQGLIKLVHDSGYSWQVLPDGRQVCGIYTDDNNFGEHLELDPLQKQFNVYDEDGVCVLTISGKAYASLDSIFGDNSGSITPISTYTSSTLTTKTATATSTSPATNEGSVQVVSTTTTSAKNAIYTSTPTRMTVKAKLTACANYFRVESGSSSSSSQLLPPSVGVVDEDGYYTVYNQAQVRIRIATFSDVNLTTKNGSDKLIGTVRSYDGQSHTTDVEASADVPAGYHVVYVDWYCYAYASTSSSYAKVSFKMTSITYVSDVYLSRLFANGLAYGTSQNNFFAAMNIEQNGANRMLVKALTENSSKYKYGFLLDNSKGFQVIRPLGNTGAVTGFVFPTVMFVNVSWAAKTSYSLGTWWTYDGSIPSLARIDGTGEGQMKITCTLINTLAMTFNNCLFLVNTHSSPSSRGGIHGHVSAVYYSASYLTVECSDDTTDNYCSFQLEVRYMGSLSLS